MHPKSATLSRSVECSADECSKWFVPRACNHIYCSSECRDRSKVLKRSRANKKKRESKTVVEKCGNPTCTNTYEQVFTRGGKRKYCSKKCGNATRERQALGKVTKPTLSQLPKHAHIRVVPDSIKPLVSVVLSQPGCSARYYAGRLGWTVPAVRVGLKVIRECE